MDRSAIILAGGQGRRMGGLNKANLSLGDETLIERQLGIVKQWSDDVIVVTNDDPFSLYLRRHHSVKVVPDYYSGEGPLAGLHAGASAASRSFIWVIGCDQPFIDIAAANFLMERMNSGTETFQAAIPIVGDRPQPLHAVYCKEVGHVAEKLLQRGDRKLLTLLNHLRWCRVEEREFVEHGLSLAFNHDIDTPEQYAKANKLLLDEK